MSRAGLVVFLVLVLVLVLGAVLPAQADYQVRGTFLYKDREFTSTGFTGNEPNLPIRFADVEVVDGTNVLARGATDATGSFTIQVTDSRTRNLVVRARTSSTQTAGLYLTVRSPANAIYAIATSYANHAPNQNIDFTASPIVAVQGNGGDAFNTYDVAVDGIDFVTMLRGSRPGQSQSLTLLWGPNSTGTFYDISSRIIYLLGQVGDSDAYDDSVILHEFGHYVEFVLAASDNPAGPHGPTDCLSMQLAWSEGYCTFLQNMVRDWKGLSRPEIYIDTTGQPGTGQLLLGYQVETPSFNVHGAGNEITVNAVLWDMFDRTTTLDANPGVDDDVMRITDTRERFWDVFTQYLPLPFVTSISIEDFWDGWFARGNGLESEMRQVFAMRSLDYFDDTFEPDDALAQARNGGIANGTTQHTIYGAGDSDWTRFDGVAGGTYLFETRNLPCGSDTEMRLWAANGTTLLAQNDDQSAGDLSSRIVWTANANGPVYLQVRRSPDIDTYGSYDLYVDIQVAVAVQDIEIGATPTGVRLAWRAEADAAFSHFDVERADAASGPWTRRNPAPLTGSGSAALYEFVDTEVAAGAHYHYRLAAVDADGTRTFFGPFAIDAAVPARLVLYPPQPNPFNPRTLLRFELPGTGPVTLRVHDLRGRVVRTLVGGDVLPAGMRTLSWDGRDDAGAAAASGMYWLRLETRQGRQTQRAVLLR